MNRLLILSILFVFGACLPNKDVKQDEKKKNHKTTNFVSENYELIIPNKQDAFLILFPCFPCNAENTRTQFNIIEIASANTVSYTHLTLPTICSV